MMRRILFAVLLLALTISSGTVWACSVPVFRYALEHWPADSYKLVVLYRGELSDEDQAKLKDLLADESPARKANVVLELADLDDPSQKQALELWESAKKPELPWMALLAPNNRQSAGRVWSGPLSRESVSNMIDSPMRRAISDRILDGDSAVWVLLECGNKEKDEAAHKMLKEQLAVLQKKLELPEVDQQDVASGLLSIDPDSLKLAFSTIRVSRDDPKEQLFVESLLSVEDDLRDEEFQGEPIAIPVFGRGRALYALLGRGINENEIARTCEFLVGACQCEVKAENPGVDLLMQTDWENLVEKMLPVDTDVPPLVGLIGFEKDPEDNSEEKVDDADAVKASDQDKEPAKEGDDPSVDPEAGKSAANDESSKDSPVASRQTAASSNSPKEPAPVSIVSSALLAFGLLGLAAVAMCLLLFKRRP